MNVAKFIKELGAIIPADGYVYPNGSVFLKGTTDPYIFIDQFREYVERAEEVFVILRKYPWFDGLDTIDSIDSMIDGLNSDLYNAEYARDEYADEVSHLEMKISQLEAKIAELE